MKDAGNTKAHSMWREMAIFILLYVISIFVEAMAMVPGLLVYIASRPDAASWFERAGSSDVTGGLWNGSVDMDKYSALLQAQPEWLLIYTLFAEILLIALYVGYCRLIEKRSFSSMGFTRGHILVRYIKGLLWAVVLFGGAYLFCIGTGAVHFGGSVSGHDTGLYRALLCRIYDTGDGRGSDLQRISSGFSFAESFGLVLCGHQ